MNNFYDQMRCKFTPHFAASVVKSMLRVGGFILLMSSISIGVTILIIAEVVSIVEELV